MLNFDIIKSIDEYIGVDSKYFLRLASKKYFSDAANYKYSYYEPGKKIENDVKFLYIFDNDDDIKIPESVEHVFISATRKKINIDLHCNVKTIDMGFSSFYVDIGKLTSLKTYRGAYHDMKTIYSLPNTITILVFPSDFNQPIVINDRPLIPNSVKYLRFGYKFNKPIVHNNKTLIPNSVVCLYMGVKFSQDIFIIPDSVKYLAFDCLINPIPDSVSKIKTTCYHNAQKISNNVTDLIIYSSHHDEKNIPIPLSVTRLTIYDITMCSVPFSVSRLCLGEYFNGEIENIIPLSVIDLEVGEFFNQNIPSHIKKLTIGCSFNKIIPDSVTHLSINNNMHELNLDKVQSLTLTNHYPQIKDIDSYIDFYSKRISKLKRLKVTHDLKKIKVPDNVIKMIVYKKMKHLTF